MLALRSPTGLPRKHVAAPRHQLSRAALRLFPCLFRPRLTYLCSAAIRTSIPTACRPCSVLLSPSRRSTSLVLLFQPPLGRWLLLEKACRRRIWRELGGTGRQGHIRGLGGGDAGGDWGKGTPGVKETASNKYGLYR